MIKDADCISSHSIVPCFMLHVVVSSKLSQGILKRECDVCSLERSKDATPDNATDNTIFFLLADMLLLSSREKFF
jgi:hypothetical protein